MGYVKLALQFLAGLVTLIPELIRLFRKPTQEKVDEGKAEIDKEEADFEKNGRRKREPKKK